MSRKKHGQAMHMAATYVKRGLSRSAALRKAWSSINKGSKKTKRRKR